VCTASRCEVVGHVKNVSVDPQCKTARYCGGARQKEDRTTGGHTARCGTLLTRVK